MKTTKIADDPINGAFSAQFRWCVEHGINKNPGPTLTGPDVQPIFHKLDKPIEVHTKECGKFGGICSSGNCREGHEKLAM
jgi:hypothetical protein